MSQDLSSTDPNEDPLVASPESQTPRADPAEGSTISSENVSNEFTIHRDESRQISARQLQRNKAKANERTDLHPYVQSRSFLAKHVTRHLGNMNIAGITYTDFGNSL